MAEIAFCKVVRPHFSQVPCRFNCAPFENILLNVQCNFIIYSVGWSDIRTHAAIPAWTHMHEQAVIKPTLFPNFHINLTREFWPLDLP